MMKRPKWSVNIQILQTSLLWILICLLSLPPKTHEISCFICSDALDTKCPNKQHAQNCVRIVDEKSHVEACYTLIEKGGVGGRADVIKRGCATKEMVERYQNETTGACKPAIKPDTNQDQSQMCICDGSGPCNGKYGSDANFINLSFLTFSSCILLWIASILKRKY